MTLSSLANVAVKPFNYARNSFSQLSRQNKTVVLVAGVSGLALTILDANRALKLQKKVSINEDLLESWQLRVSNYKVLKQLRMDTSAESSLSCFQLPPLVENTPLSWKFIFSYWPAARLEKNACGYLALAQEVKKINEQLKNLYDKLLEIKTLEESNQNNIEIIHEFCSADTSYRIEILNESARLQFISYLSTSIRLSLELVSLTQTDRQSSKSYQELREELNSIATTTTCYSIKNRLETASEACYLLEKMGFPIEKLSATPQSSQLKSCFSKLAEVGKGTFKARVAAVAKAVRIEIASLDELEQANPQMSQRLDEDIAPLFTKFLASFPTKFCDVKECEELSLTPISDTSDIWKVLKRFFLLKISQHSSKGTPLAAIENILKTSNSLSTAFFYLKHGIIYSISSNANSFFFKGQRQASFSQEHLLFTLLDSDGTRLLFHPNTNKGIEQGSNFYLESFFENKEAAQNFSLVDLFLKSEIIFEGYMLREKDLPFLRISQILWSPLIDLKEMQTATSQFFASGSDMQRLSLVAHLDEFHPSFTPSDDWEEKKLSLAYLGYLKAAEVFITEKERAAIEQLPIGSSHQRVHVGIAATIIQHVIPFLEGLTYPSTANTITRKLQEYCLDTFEDDEQISNTFMFMLRLAELKNSSTALENLIEHYIKPKLGADHPSSECFKAAFQWVQGIKVTAEEQMSANLSRETEELDEEVAAVAKAVDRDELFSEIKSLVASPIRSGMFAALLAKLAPFPELRAIELPDNLQTASGSQYTIARLEEDALAILEELKGLTDRKDADISSGSSTSKESNSDDSHTLEKPVSILEFITEEDEGELLHTIKLLIIEHMKNKNIAKLSFSTQRIFEAILSQLQDHFFYYQSTDERLGNKTHIGIATQDNSSLNNERSALFRALLRAPIQELYQFAEYSNPIEKDLLALDKIAPSFNPSLAQAITGVFEGVLGPIIFKAVSEEDA